MVSFLTISSGLGQQFGKEMLDGKKSITLPFDYNNGFIVVNIVYGNTFPLRFVFDTGAEHTVLFKRVYADLLNTVYDQKINIYGADLSINMTAMVARKVAIQLDKTKSIDKDIVILEDKFLDLEEVTGVRIDGIIGGEYFKGLVVEINYKKRKIILYDPDTFDKNLEKFRPIPSKIIKNKPYIITGYSETGDSSKQATMLLDSGASLTCLFHHNSDETIKLPSNAITGSLGRGLGGSIEGYMGKISTLQVGEFTFNNLISNYQSLDTNLYDMTKITRNGILGNLLLERFTVIINYREEQVFLKPNKKYNKKFKYDKSGLFLYAFGPKLNKYLIKRVIKGSPADRAGLKSGDVIKKIGFWSTKWYTLQGLSNKFCGKDGKNIKLKVDRKGEPLTFKFKLKDLFDAE